MDEKVKNKDADPAPGPKPGSSLEEGLEDTFPASDPVSTTRPGGDDAEDVAKAK